jgi:hypothetical protein
VRLNGIDHAGHVIMVTRVAGAGNWGLGWTSLTTGEAAGKHFQRCRNTMFVGGTVIADRPSRVNDAGYDTDRALPNAKGPDADHGSGMRVSPMRIGRL